MTVYTDVVTYNSDTAVRSVYEKIGHSVTDWSTSDVVVNTGRFTMIDADVTFTATSTPLPYGYTINYVDSNGAARAAPVTGTELYGTSFDAERVAVTGYTAPDAIQVMRITEIAENNVVTYVYSINSHDVIYKIDGQTVLTIRTAAREKTNVAA